MFLREMVGPTYKSLPSHSLLQTRIVKISYGIYSRQRLDGCIRSVDPAAAAVYLELPHSVLCIRWYVRIDYSQHTSK